MREDELTLVQKAKRGEAEAFGKLYDTYISPIYRFIFLKVGHREDAEDLSHQVFLNAWQNIGGYKFQGFPFSSWLYTIARNAVIDYYRTKKPRIDIENVPEEKVAEMPETAQAIDDAFDIVEIKKALAHLEEEQQTLLVMRFVNDLSTKEIAHILGKSEVSVRVMQHRALKHLKTLLAESNDIREI